MTEISKTVCDVCGVESKDEKQKRSENWLVLNGELRVWLERPRKKDGSFMLSIGYQRKHVDFCSINCLAKALKGKESIA